MYFSTQSAENQAFFQENPLVFIGSALYNSVCHTGCKGSECHGVQKTNRSLLCPPAGQLLGHDQLYLRLSGRDRPRPGLYDRTGRNFLRAVLSGKPFYAAGHRRLGRPAPERAHQAAADRHAAACRGAQSRLLFHAPRLCAHGADHFPVRRAGDELLSAH